LIDDDGLNVTDGSLDVAINTIGAVRYYFLSVTKPGATPIAVLLYCEHFKSQLQAADQIRRITYMALLGFSTEIVVRWWLQQRSRGSLPDSSALSVDG
jgi:hypothetical protein